jgi:rare lipoprotein A
MNMTRKINSVALAIAGVLSFPGCTSTGQANSDIQTQPQPLPEAPQFAVKSIEHGKASWYSIRTNRGTHTASGQRLCDNSATAAHKTLPMGTKVRVTNEINGKSEIVTINNRGPYIRGRIIDVTIGTASRLGFRERGVVPCKVEVLTRVQSDN